MIALHQFPKTAGKRGAAKRVGRGIGSGLGKTSGRGAKGAKSRSGYKRRYGNEGGNVPSHQKFPKRGFTRGHFFEELNVINLDRIDELFGDGDLVNSQTLRDKGYLKKIEARLKVLGRGKLTKKVRLECSAMSKTARDKLDTLGATYCVA